MTVGLQHALFLSCYLGRLQQGGSPLTARSPWTCQVLLRYGWEGWTKTPKAPGSTQVRQKLLKKVALWQVPETVIEVLQGKRDTSVLLGTSRVCSSEFGTCISPSLHELREEGTHRLFGAVINTVLKKEDKPSILTPMERRNPDTQADSIERQILSSFWAVIKFVN